MQADIKDYMYRLVISQLFYDKHQQLALSLASSIGCSINPPAPCDKLFRLISIAKQFNEAFNFDDTRMPVATCAQKRKWEPERKKIQDLPFKLVEKIARYLDVKDVLELMMVNKRLYAMNRSIVFGKHVAVVALAQKGSPMKWIRKFVDSQRLKLNDLYGTLPFAKRIDSCDKLVFGSDQQHNALCDDGRRYTDATFLNQLKSVNQLEVCVDTKEDCVEFLSNFRGSVKQNTTLCIKIDLFEQDETMKEQFGKFFENQLTQCEKIALDCNIMNCLYACYEAMMRTQIKTILIETFEFDQIVDWIVNQGIPSKNSAAVICLLTRSWDSRAGGFLAQVQGLQRIDDGEKHSALISCANQLLRENDVRRSACMSKVFVSDENSTSFRHQIDATTSCIYVFQTDPYCLQFLAFYMPPQ